MYNCAADCFIMALKTASRHGVANSILGIPCYRTSATKLWNADLYGAQIYGTQILWYAIGLTRIGEGIS